MGGKDASLAEATRVDDNSLNGRKGEGRNSTVTFQWALTLNYLNRRAVVSEILCNQK